MSNTLISKTIDAVEIFSNSNLTLETNTQIQFNTQQLLVNFIPLDQFIKHIVFDVNFITILNRDSANESNNDNSSQIDLTDPYNNNATLSVDSVYCANISANNSKVEINNGTETTSKYHCITFSTSNHLILNNTSDYNNIEYNRTDQHVSSLSNYIYHVLNETTFTGNDLDPNVFDTTGAIDVSNFGTYFTNKIITSNVTTSNVYDGSGTMEPILDISSYSAVNLHIYQDGGATLDTEGLSNIASNIILGDNATNLKDYIYSFLDETVLYTLTVSGTGYPGVEITLDTIIFEREFNRNMSQLTNDPFTYDIVFKIYEYSSEEPNPFRSAVSPSNGIDPLASNVRANPSFFPPTTSFTFDNLTPGTFYSIYADITNNVTNTVVNNIEVASNIPTIPFNEIVSVEILSENAVKTTFSPHDVQTTTTLNIGFSNSVLQTTGDNYFDTYLSQNLSDSVPPNNFEYEYTLTGNLVSSNLYVKIKNSLDMEVEYSTIIDTNTVFPTPARPVLRLTSNSFEVTPGTRTNPINTLMTYTFYNNTTLMFSHSTTSNDSLFNVNYTDDLSYHGTDHSLYLVGDWDVTVTNPYDKIERSSTSNIIQPTASIDSLVYNNNVVREYKLNISNLIHNG